MRRYAAAELERHVAQELLPLWARHAADPVGGGFFNRLDASLQPVLGEPKRLLVQTRLLYAFASAGQRDAAVRAYAFMCERLRDRDRGGWYLSEADQRKDLYVHAFVLFALAHYHRATGDGDALHWAEWTWDVLCERLADHEHGGFFEAADVGWGDVVRTPRRQNPHMHLLEALQALGWRAEADAMVALFRRRWFDPERGCLGEVYDARWAPDLAAELEPGHHFEWVWLLRGAPEADALYRFASTHGVDRDGGVFDAIGRDGRVRRATKRLWPQTERLRALAARGERDALQAALGDVLGRYVQPEHGGWHEQLDRAGRVTSTAMNATSVYHVVGALRAAADALR